MIRFSENKKDFNEAIEDLKFFWNGIKVKGKLIRCFFSNSFRMNGKEGISISTRDTSYFPKEIKEVFTTVTNDTDIMIDYFDSDRIFVEKSHPYYPLCLKAFLDQEAHYKQKAMKA